MSAVLYARKLIRRDLCNFIRYGRHAPLWTYPIWVDPTHLKRFVYGWGDRHAAVVIGGEWKYDAATAE